MCLRFLGGIYKDNTARPEKPYTNGQAQRMESDATSVNSAELTTNNWKKDGYINIADANTKAMTA